MQEFNSYKEAIDAVVAVRNHRRELYGDTWKKDEDWMLLAQIVSKTNRLKNLILEKKIDSNGYDSIIDNATDLINYTLFLLANKLELKNEELHK